MTKRALQGLAVRTTLMPPTSLAEAIATLGFVQADPIRMPARAQDLILRQRVAGYRAGDLERQFVGLGLEEDFFYAHGFMPPAVRHLLHPRGAKGKPKGLAADVLAYIQAQGPVHPADLEAQFGRKRARNAWGGFSKATTRMMQLLHRQGHLRIAQRRDGIRIYEAAAPLAAPLETDERRRQLVLLVASILAPVTQTTLRQALNLVGSRAVALRGFAATIQALLRAGALETAEIDGERYLWPAGMQAAETERQVRFLAPFDPIVWDRRRFEHLWGWAYRLEAYTPPKKRQFGYYAMPLLWGDRVIGWVNAARRSGGLDIDAGFVGARPKDRAFARGFDDEVARLKAFLGHDVD